MLSRCRLIAVTACFSLGLSTWSVRADMITLTPSQDTFAWANQPNSTFGSAGALSVAGDTAVNGDGNPQGIFDTWLKFNTATAISQFNGTYGAGNWTLSSAVLSLQEVAAPGNPVFNCGVGHFNITWIADDNWTEGPGNPDAPGTATGNQIGYSYGLSILNGSNDELVGLHQNAGNNSRQNFSLNLTSGLNLDVLSGGAVSLYLSALDSDIGFTFNSTTVSPANRPQLILHAIPEPATAMLVSAGVCLICWSRRRRR